MEKNDLKKIQMLVIHHTLYCPKIMHENHNMKAHLRKNINIAFRVKNKHVSNFIDQ